VPRGVGVSGDPPFETFFLSPSVWKCDTGPEVGCGPRPRKWCTGAVAAPSVDCYAARFFLASSGAGSETGSGLSSASTVR
jgi:hypothetical protein